jgi:hypothetical protein
MDRAAVFAAFVGVCVACSASKGDEDDDGAVHNSGGDGGIGGNFLVGGGGDGGTGAGGGCAEGAELVYVLTDSNLLYSFKPDERLFTLIGTLGCNTGMLPNSMAVDRNAVAWVNYVASDGISDTAGAIFEVSTLDASCEPAPTVDLDEGWYRIGMGFSTDGIGTDAETLFVASINGNAALGYIDREAASLVQVATFSGDEATYNAELTGTGDGRLYAFFIPQDGFSPVRVGQVDKTTAAVIDPVTLTSVEVPDAWAFSFWGGDFWLYTAAIGNSRVNHYTLPNTVDTSYMPDVGFRIVGAGVSTCAPLQPPE